MLWHVDHSVGLSIRLLLRTCARYIDSDPAWKGRIRRTCSGVVSIHDHGTAIFGIRGAWRPDRGGGLGITRTVPCWQLDDWHALYDAVVYVEPRGRGDAGRGRGFVELVGNIGVLGLLHVCMYVYVYGKQARLCRNT
jgi:hypothetical protein